MKLFTTVGVGHLWVSHHGRALFALPNPTKTIITRPSKLLYDDNVDGESGGADGGGHDDDDAHEAPRVHVDSRRAPAGPRGAQPSTAAISSGLWVHPCFRQFSTVLINYKFRTRKSYATSRTWPTWLTRRMSTISGYTRHLIGALTAPETVLINAL